MFLGDVVCLKDVGVYVVVMMNEVYEMLVLMLMYEVGGRWWVGWMEVG